VNCEQFAQDCYVVMPRPRIYGCKPDALNISPPLSITFFCLNPCGRLSWLFVLHVKYTISYAIVSWCLSNDNRQSELPDLCRVGDSVTHVRIQNEGEFFNLHGPGGDTFATLGELVRYYTDDNAQPLSDTVGTVIELKYPLPSVDHHNERYARTLRTAEQFLAFNPLMGSQIIIVPRIE